MGAGIGERLRIPVVAYYHSHFPQAYLRGPARWLGRKGQTLVMRGAEAYVCNLYNRFEATLVASAQLAGNCADGASETSGSRRWA